MAHQLSSHIDWLNAKADGSFDGSLEDWQKLAKSIGKGIIKSGAVSGAYNPDDKEAQEHAVRYYGLVRSMNTDVERIAKNTGYSEKTIQEIKNYIFMEKHDLGGEELEYFVPDYKMGESWRRLLLGSPEPHDLILLKHEIMEHELVSQGKTQEEAHYLTSEKYDYGKEANKSYDKNSNHKKRRE